MPSFPISIADAANFLFVFDSRLGARDYYASHPIRNADGDVVGVAVLVKSLDSFEADLREYDRPYFFIDPTGLIVTTKRPEALHRTLRPLSAAKRADLIRRFAALSNRPMLEQDLVDATWTNVDGECDYVRRRFANHSDWSLVILKPTRPIFATASWVWSSLCLLQSWH